jgi:hypothetical protein
VKIPALALLPRQLVVVLFPLVVQVQPLLTRCISAGFRNTTKLIQAFRLATIPSVVVPVLSGFWIKQLTSLQVMIRLKKLIGQKFRLIAARRFRFLQPDFSLSWHITWTV